MPTRCLKGQLDLQDRSSKRKLPRNALNGPRAADYLNMIENYPAGRAGTSDEVANLATLMMGPEGAFISGSDFLMDGSVTASFHFDGLAPR